jgi:hypothetical protein
MRASKPRLEDALVWVLELSAVLRGERGDIKEVPRSDGLPSVMTERVLYAALISKELQQVLGVRRHNGVPMPKQPWRSRRRGGGKGLNATR